MLVLHYGVSNESPSRLHHHRPDIHQDQARTPATQPALATSAKG